MLSSQSSSRRMPNSGTHRMLSVIFFNDSRIGSMLINHSSTNRKTSSVPHRQQTG